MRTMEGDRPIKPAHDTRREVVSNEYCRVTYDPSTRIARFIRSSTPIRSLEEAARHFGQAVSLINALGRNKISLILDMREAPSRNDPQFEEAMAEHRRQVARDISRVAVIVKTAVGRLHVQRLGETDRIKQGIVTTDEDAVEHVLRGEH